MEISLIGIRFCESHLMTLPRTCILVAISDHLVYFVMFCNPYQFLLVTLGPKPDDYINCRETLNTDQTLELDNVFEPSVYTDF